MPILPAGLQGYVAAEQQARERNDSNMRGMLGILNAQGMLQQQQYLNELKPLEVEQRKLAMQQSIAKDVALRALAGGPGFVQPGSPGGGVLSGAGPGGGASDQQYLNALAAGIDPKLIGAMRDITTPKMEVSGGYAFDPRRLGPGFMPSLNVGREGQATMTRIGTDGLPVVSAPEGALNTFSAYKNAAEEAAARVKPFMGQVDDRNRPIPQTELQFAQGVGSVGQVPQAGAERTAAPTDAVALQRVMDAERRGVPASVTVAGQVPAAPRGMGLDPGQRTAAETAGREEGQLVTGYRQKIPTLNTTMRRLDTLERLNSDDKTYAAGGAEFKTLLGNIAQGFGLEIAKDKTATSELYLAQIGELMKDRLGSKDYGSGSGVSNLDLLAAKQPLPELAKTRQGRQDIINAIRLDTQASLQDMTAATQHFDRNLSLSGFTFPSSQARDQRGRDVDNLVRTQAPAPITSPRGGRGIDFSTWK